MISVSWIEVGLGVLGAALVGVALWAFLPRGVILNRSVRAQDWNGNPLYDTWEVKNDSPLPVFVRSVRVSGFQTFNEETGEIDKVDLPPDGLMGVTLHFDDHALEVARTDQPRPDQQGSWAGLVIPPGETLQAHVEVNTMLYIDYRRAGWSGVLERRSLTIHGYA